MILTSIVDLRQRVPITLASLQSSFQNNLLPPLHYLSPTPPSTVKNVPEISRRKKVCLEIFEQLQDSHSACPSFHYFLISPFIWLLFSQVDKHFAN